MLLQSYTTLKLLLCSSAFSTRLALKCFTHINPGHCQGTLLISLSVPAYATPTDSVGGCGGLWASGAAANIYSQGFIRSELTGNIKLLPLTLQSVVTPTVWMFAPH
ncbi:hypothetical protein CgunFtcFv8_004705 [Champsocephalus gunnari]|uniref:Secreted protein n=1 Tax=Champsocephalus gunnari TaxID=52237 RepID=A0AAN8E4Q0_CHAGU|nr:hypothetical protein CgunFtcFv8_004705 [Champsocephalus gunnari]